MKNTPVTPQSNIQEIVSENPKVAKVFIEYGLHCVGCAISKYETIEQGALGHGMDQETIESLIDEINIVITKDPGYPVNDKGITLSPRAVEMVKSLMKEDPERAKGLQVKAQRVEDELEYFLDLVSKPEQGEDTIEWEGVSIFIDENSLRLMKPSIIDFLKTSNGEGFKVIRIS